ncbi:MAG: Gfo/Idh/MocA family oxidoreductase [Candidatus Solibacter usitatus]|nr:Gfo/Idh/MocA family oxidoreductase [Candidatus Solibacter usitatus]
MESKSVSRRSFLNSSAAPAAGVAAFQIIRPELVRGQGKAKLRAGLIGCGGRGRQAVVDMMDGSENTELVAMADIFEDKLEGNLTWLKTQHAKHAARIKVDAEHRFVGFEAYKKIITSPDVDIVMLATPPGYRPMHFEAAIEAKKHVFCEKPFGTDPVGVRRFMAAAKKSEELKLTVMSGAQRRFDSAYMQTIDKIKNGAIGDITGLYAYWVGTPVIQQANGRNARWGDMEWEHRNWYSYVWICGDQVVEQHLHNIDVCNWVMGTHPVKVWAQGGRIWRPNDEMYGNIYDHLSADFEYANGVRMSSYCRQYPGQTYRNVSELIIGSKGRSKGNDMGQRSGNPYVNEHTALMNSIRGDGPYINHAMAVAETTMTCIMAREAAYTGEEITWDRIMKSQLDLQPKEFGYNTKIEMTPIPIPGKYKLI